MIGVWSEAHFSVRKQVPIKVVVVGMMLYKPAKIYFEKAGLAVKAEKLIVVEVVIDLNNLIQMCINQPFIPPPFGIDYQIVAITDRARGPCLRA